jgi:hypothetical protein
MRSLDGVLVTVGTVPIQADRAEVPVEIADMTLEPGSHFATLLSRGFYNVAVDAKGVWTIVEYRATE